MTIYAPVLAVDCVSPDAAQVMLDIAATEIAAATPLTPAEIRDLRYRVAWASEHGTPCPLSTGDAFRLLAMVSALASPVGRLLSSLTVDEVAALPAGSRFEDPADGDTWRDKNAFTRVGDLWKSLALSACSSSSLREGWGHCSYVLVRIGGAS